MEENMTVTVNMAGLIGILVCAGVLANITTILLLAVFSRYFGEVKVTCTRVEVEEKE
jgi:hypothetical protein